MSTAYYQNDSSQRRIDRAEELEAPVPKQNTWALSIGSALGGALLLFLGQVAVEEYKAYRQGITDEQAARAARVDAQQRLADEMVQQFGEIGPVAIRAGKLIDTGRGGSRADIEEVARHFRLLSRYIANDRVTTNQVAPNYGGPLIYWNERFRKLADQTTPAADNFSESELASFALLANALENLSQQMTPAGDDPFKQVANERRPAPRPRPR